MNWIKVLEIIYVIIVIFMCLRIIYNTRSSSKTLAYLLLANRINYRNQVNNIGGIPIFVSMGQALCIWSTFFSAIGIFVQIRKYNQSAHILVLFRCIPPI